MIITEQKPFEEVVESLQGCKSVFIIGCGSCATAWHTGGETEVKEIAEKLQGVGKTITGWMVVEECCDERKEKRDLRAHAAEVAPADCILVMSCGAGVQTVALLHEDKPVYPGLNALYLARIQRLSKADERCVLCGECILAKTGGICPVATCPKELMNGPCGGYKDGMCEVDPTRECTWISIYKRQEKLGQLDQFAEVKGPKDQTKRHHPRRLDKAAA
ncbi:MAG: methylenetetrahydrofolate reductase C-terminal domain-containing protein [Chloroflexi bacterium]|nr:methylenetetrahydrofolate reductase C-terminal domain-containing protein [Chloroflexota bacterium]